MLKLLFMLSQFLLILYWEKIKNKSWAKYFYSIIIEIFFPALFIHEIDNLFWCEKKYNGFRLKEIFLFLDSLQRSIDLKKCASNFLFTKVLFESIFLFMPRLDTVFEIEFSAEIPLFRVPKICSNWLLCMTGWKLKNAFSTMLIFSVEIKSISDTDIPIKVRLSFC